MACVVQGYDEALEREQTLRNIAYLDTPEVVCGEPLRNITPRIYTALQVMRTPFLIGGSVTLKDVARFLWACHVHFSPNAWWKRRALMKRASNLDLARSIQEIENFLEVTFLDAPKGGRDTKPIASGTAWLVYQFRGEPWRQPEAATLEMPLRKLYQELRCAEVAQGGAVSNPSDKLKGTWLQRVNEAFASGELTQEELDAWNARYRQGRN